jgi:hypothetical protein
MNKMNKKQWVVFVVWFVCFNTVEYFFRFKFGLNQIALVFIVIGLALTWLFRTKSK